MIEVLKRLKEFTKDCGEDMHEPDNQGIFAVVSGYHLDNAMGHNPADNMGEFTVGLQNENQEGHYEWFNLANVGGDK